MSLINAIIPFIIAFIFVVSLALLIRKSKTINKPVFQDTDIGANSVLIDSITSDDIKRVNDMNSRPNEPFLTDKPETFLEHLCQSGQNIDASSDTKIVETAILDYLDGKL